MLSAYNSFLASMDKFLPVPPFRVDVLQGEPSLQLNGLSTGGCIHCILEVKDHQCIYLVFPVTRAHVDKATAYLEDAELTNMSTMYSELFLEFYSRKSN